MSSLVNEFQLEIKSGRQTVTELLRSAILIAAKLNIPSVEDWISKELNGYPEDEDVPNYRLFTGQLEAHNPYQGWLLVGGDAFNGIALRFPMASIEKCASERVTYLSPPQRIPLQGIASSFAQRIGFGSGGFHHTMETVKNKLLLWAIELEKRGILGENMSFNEKEKAAAQNIHIGGNFTGVLGSVTGSTVSIYDYSQIHQTLKQNNVPQEARNEIENILDELKHAKGDEKASKIERIGKWLEQWGPMAGAAGKWLEGVMSQ